jgi:3-isopropylmalate/(R)-2-methylmalate dehydratase small subunit|tara:strand:- start:3104 stop:3742 length:639 start_codon:yes stop_codon:yes gene_type:complete
MKNDYNFHIGTMAPFPRDHIDTDQIIPKQFLKSIKKSGFGLNLFDGWRYKDEGFPEQDINERILNEEFVLNKKQFLGADILLSKQNFGCGSSREHAVWSLMDYGFKIVIAESFADIFYNNCFKNGLLPITLERKKIDDLFVLAQKNKTIQVDLIGQRIYCEDQEVSAFEIDPFRKESILEGLDEIGLSLKFSDDIKEFENKSKINSPWIFKS